MTHNLEQFHRAFPTEKACLAYIFTKNHKAHCACGGTYYPLTKRRCYSCSRCARQVYPLKGTIFSKSRTPLMKWFLLMYLFSVSKNGISAAETRRILGVTDKAAWRMCRQIRTLMKQDDVKLKGVVEADETYICGRRKLDSWKREQVCVIGMVERGGRLKVQALPGKGEYHIVPFVEKNLVKGSTLYTDGAHVYDICQGYERGKVYHSMKEYVRGDIHTNSIEGVWSQIKRSLNGTYHGVTKRHLPLYLDQFVFYYNASRLSYDPFLKMVSQL